MSEARVDPLLELVEPSVRGDRAALGELLRALAPRVSQVARAVLGANHAELDDAVQEGLIAIVDALPAFRGECSVGHFAGRIAARKCVSVRQRSVKFQLGREQMAWRSVVGAAPAGGSVGLRAVRELVGALPEEQSETMVLRFVLGMTLAEVSSATGAPLNTVRSRLRLARAALRRRIDRDWAAAGMTCTAAAW